MTDTYVNLSQALRKTRTTLTKACYDLDLDQVAIDTAKLQVKCCDWCGYWDTPRNMTIEEDETVYCKACVESDYI